MSASDEQKLTPNTFSTLMSKLQHTYVLLSITVHKALEGRLQGYEATLVRILEIVTLPLAQNTMATAFLTA